MPEQLFREMIEDAGFRDFTMLRRSPNLRTETAGSDVITFRAWRKKASFVRCPCRATNG
jgi:hypothetical protein